MPACSCNARVKQVREKNWVWIAVIQGSRAGDHLLQGDSEFVRAEGTAFADFSA